MVLQDSSCSVGALSVSLPDARRLVCSSCHQPPLLAHELHICSVGKHPIKRFLVPSLKVVRATVWCTCNKLEIEQELLLYCTKATELAFTLKIYELSSKSQQHL